MTTRTAPAPIAVLATHELVAPREDHMSLEEMIFACSSTVLKKAGLDHSTLEGVVMSGQDQIDGRVISCMPSAGPAGGVGRDVTMIASSGDHALVYGWMRLLSGQGSNVLVIGWSKPSESVSLAHSQSVSAEPFVLRAVGMNDTIAASLQASRWYTPDAPVEDPVSWPLSAEDLPADADAVYAAVLATADQVGPDGPIAWISGAGWSTDQYDMGSRDLTENTPLRQALAQIEQISGVPRARTWDVVEIAAASEPAVQRAAEALDLPATARVNPSGSLRERPAPAHVSGLGRMLAALDAVGKGEASHAAAVGLHGFAGQGATVMVFSGEQER